MPAVWMLAAVTVALFGVVPRFTPVAWGVLVAFVALFLLGSISGFPQWILDLEPFSHAPKLPGGQFEATPVVWCQRSRQVAPIARADRRCRPECC